MQKFGYDRNYASTDYKNGEPAALGNYIAEKLIEFGLQDGANEMNDYANQFYEPLNEPLNTDLSGNPEMTFPNHWQPLKVESYVDQSGNTIPGGQPPFLSPEWGNVVPFSLNENDAEVVARDGFNYKLYHNPGAPWYLNEGMGLTDPYKWGFALVAIWGAHMDATLPATIDISPGNLGNLELSEMPASFQEFQEFYNLTEGGDPSTGRETNPVTGQPYQPQEIPLGDYTRVLAEFWADGPDSETPPGHWFTILNYVSDNPLLEKKYRGRGAEMTDLEWDVKSYFLLGGAMHDVAVTAWGLKGYYDYVRPISAIRYMAQLGQSTNVNGPSYHPHGLPLVPGYIEVIEEGDDLAGAFNENLGKMKLFTWRGPDRIVDPLEDTAGVGWILAEEWFPYQRPSFVTPPFAGYVSGHSTYSRAAAEVLTLLTGDEFFPGGMGVFDIEANSFLTFEKGPSVSMQLQWATYRDASDQTSLSRIWGGIHPPIDDIPGRLIGERVGKNAFAFGERYFSKSVEADGLLFPNPATTSLTVLYSTQRSVDFAIYDIQGRVIVRQEALFSENSQLVIDVSALSEGLYFLSLLDDDSQVWTRRFLKAN
ncbi:MAG: hypothetical protein CMC08_07505 [Flavobacteriaceae bacterium]|nr:hypothetical protein [Flavobacteriaceae bacterium]